MTPTHVEDGVARDADEVRMDEMRLGLRGQVGRVPATRGVEVPQRLQLTYGRAHRLLAVNPRTGIRRWACLEHCRAEPIKQALVAWELGTTAWDGAGLHRTKLLTGLRTRCVLLPPRSPELSSAECVFEQRRHRSEGRS